MAIGDQQRSTDYQALISLPGSPRVMFRSTVVTVTNAYCPPNILASGCSSSRNLDNFILVGQANTRINDLNTGCAAGNYDNRTSQSATLMAGIAYTAFASSLATPGQNLGIWIDFDNDCVFEPSEQVATRVLNSTLNTPVVLTIPTVAGGAVLGVHRMRVAVLYNVPVNPCGPPATFGEMHDYSVNIIATASKLHLLKINFLIPSVVRFLKGKIFQEEILEVSIS